MAPPPGSLPLHSPPKPAEFSCTPFSSPFPPAQHIYLLLSAKNTAAISFLSILTLNGKLPIPRMAYRRWSIHSDHSLLHPTSHHCQLLPVPESPHCAPSHYYPGPSTISPSYGVQCPFKWAPAPEPCSPQQLGDPFKTHFTSSLRTHFHC